MVTFVINYVVAWVRVSVDFNANIDAIQFGMVHEHRHSDGVQLCYPVRRYYFMPILTIADCL